MVTIKHVLLSLFTFSVCGLSDGLSFKSINDDDIIHVQEFIREELLHHILPENRKDTCDFDLVHFFGPFYMTQTEKFAFSLGERQLIKEMALYVSKYVGEKGLRYFQEINLKCGKGNLNKTNVCSIGRYFINEHTAVRKKKRSTN